MQFQPNEASAVNFNDLTQLALGVDRDSEIIAHLFDERDEAVEKMVAQGIDSISLNPDVVLKTTMNVLEAENQQPTEET